MHKFYHNFCYLRFMYFFLFFHFRTLQRSPVTCSMVTCTTGGLTRLSLSLSVPMESLGLTLNIADLTLLYVNILSIVVCV